MRFLRSLLPFFAGAISVFLLDVEGESSITASRTYLIMSRAARSQSPSLISYVTTVDHPVINTPSHHVHHLSRFDLTFEIHGGSQRVKLELEPNHDILADEATIHHIDESGNIYHEEPIERHAHRVFRGRALVQAPNGKWNPTGWARIYMKQDGPHPLFDGAFSVANDDHHIELQSIYLDQKREGDADITPSDEDYMVVYRASDMMDYVHTELKRSWDDEPSTCRAHKLHFNSNPQHPVFQAYANDTSNWQGVPTNSLFGLSKRQSDIGGVSGNAGGVNYQSTIGDTSGCPDVKKVALIGVATDCEYVQSFKSNDSARDQVISVINTASNLYEKSLNISIGLRNLRLVSSKCLGTPPSDMPWNAACDSGMNITERLNKFSQWRGNQPDHNAYWTLMSNCATKSEVGLSWLGQLCNSEVQTQGSESVSGTNIVVRTQAKWRVFAHESGHTFGAVHDCTPQTCSLGYAAESRCCPDSSTQCSAGGQYIMSPSTGRNVENFSPCTIGNICSALGRNSVNSTCLYDNRGLDTYTHKCGNGIVESGEDCDCGGVEFCGNNTCCDPKTCKFKNGAVCDDSNESCCSNCQFSPAGTVCRQSGNICDIPETCSGNSSACPPDSHKPNGEQCGNSSGLACASGQCTSRAQQCQDVVDPNSTPCDPSSCVVSCNTNKFGTYGCYMMHQNFLDGTPCGGGGHCKNGDCKGSNDALYWINNHKKVVIAVASVLGGMIVLSLLWCLISRCRRARQTPRAPGPAAPMQYPSAWPGSLPPQAPMSQWASPPNRGYHDLGDVPPPPPQPVYGRFA